MKKLLLISAFALLFTIFSCTPDEYETPVKKETKKDIKPSKSGYADGGPGDGVPPPPPPEDK
ncbi:hypothetical protein [Flavobacterium foetidum]|uniref:hypothetical protein n=1 Tax=Flavobacterium foetidum TaxID=2026681 RepID=UPI001074F710|nr:hypothetical protein [Flavobacterium foetidum]KAF2517200.1 hypothetical protein E0W73_03630 [Flavobacterium foetidum]